jgi:hypothetical protein
MAMSMLNPQPTTPNAWYTSEPAIAAVRGVAALLVLAAGLLHLHLWDGGYRHVDNIGVMFLVNAVSSIVIAVALVVWRHWIAALAAFGLVIGSLAAFGVTRMGWDLPGFSGFEENGWNPSPEAAAAVAVEIAAAALLVWTLAATFAAAPARVRDQLPPPVTGRDGLPRLTPPAA